LSYRINVVSLSRYLKEPDVVCECGKRDDSGRGEAVLTITMEERPRGLVWSPEERFLIFGHGDKVTRVDMSQREKPQLTVSVGRGQTVGYLFFCGRTLYAVTAPAGQREPNLFAYKLPRLEPVGTGLPFSRVAFAHGNASGLLAVLEKIGSHTILVFKKGQGLVTRVNFRGSLQDLDMDEAGSMMVLALKSSQGGEKKDGADTLCAFELPEGRQLWCRPTPEPVARVYLRGDGNLVALEGNGYFLLRGRDGKLLGFLGFAEDRC